MAVEPDHSAGKSLSDELSTLWKSDQFAAIVERASQAIELDPTLADAWWWRGRARGALGQHETSIEDCTEAIHLDAQHAQAYRSRGVARMTLKDFAAARADLDEAIRLDPDSPLARINRGQLFQYQSEFDEAIREFEEAIRLDPANPDGWYLRAYLRLYQHDWTGALNDCDEVLQRQPRSALRAGVLRIQAECYFKRNDKSAGFKALDEAIALHSHYAEGLYTRAFYRKKYGDLDGALADSDEVLRLTPEVPVAYLIRADILRERGDLAGAVACWRRYLELSDVNRELIEYRIQNTEQQMRRIGLLKD